MTKVDISWDTTYEQIYSETSIPNEIFDKGNILHGKSEWSSGQYHLIDGGKSC